MSFFRTYDDELDYIGICLVSMWILGVIALTVFLIYYFVDEVYVKPIADTNANNYCKSLGFDQYKTFSRVGLWSENPVGIKCEYAERYTDLGVRTNSQSPN